MKTLLMSAALAAVFAAGVACFGPSSKADKNAPPPPAPARPAATNAIVVP